MFKSSSRPRRNDLRSFRTDDRGAVDLPSTMVTVVILAALFAAIALTVFKIVPWVQDNMMKHDAETIAAAQELYRTKIAGDVPSPVHGFATLPQLVAAGLISDATAAKPNITVALMTKGVTPGTATPLDMSDDGFSVTVTNPSSSLKTITVKGGQTTP